MTPQALHQQLVKFDMRRGLEFEGVAYMFKDDNYYSNHAMVRVTKQTAGERGVHIYDLPHVLEAPPRQHWDKGCFTCWIGYLTLIGPVPAGFKP